MQDPSVESLEEDPAAIKTENILIVAENSNNRRWLSLLLKQWQCPHDATADLASGLKKLHKSREDRTPFSILLLDTHHLPLEHLTETLQSDSGFPLPELSLLLMVPLGSHEHPPELGDVAVSAFLEKPVKRSALYDCLRAIASGTAQAPLTRTGEPSRPTPPIHANPESVRILLVEDNTINQQVSLGLLAAMGYRADLASGGEESLEKLGTGPYDLVFMDVEMPTMDGYQTTTAIRNREPPFPNRDVPIVAITAHASPEHRQKAMAVGMNDYITKSISDEAVAESIRKWACTAVDRPAQKPETEGQT